MQAIDKSDPRRPNVQVAAAIRADILCGELQAGDQLPSQEELARIFEVARMTVSSAVRTLENEGFVTIRHGSGVFVTDRTRHPVTEESGHHPLEPVASYVYEMGFLKRTPRTGWLMLGVANPESVAEHSFRVATIGIALAALEGADVGRTTAMCVLHDSAETRISDIASVSRAYLIAARPEAVSVDQTARMPDETGTVYRELIAEFERGETPEARCAKDADKLELLATAREYEQNGYDTTEWQQTSAEALRTKSGQWLGQAIIATSPVEWWQSFTASYHEIKATAKRRGAGPKRRNSRTPEPDVICLRGE